MSKKSWFGRNKAKVSLPKEQAPRAIEEITKEYTDVAGRLGQSEYQAFVFTKETSLLKDRMLALNNEAARRNAIDQQAKAAEVAANTTGDANV